MAVIQLLCRLLVRRAGRLPLFSTTLSTGILAATTANMTIVVLAAPAAVDVVVVVSVVDSLTLVPPCLLPLRIGFKP